MTTEVFRVAIPNKGRLAEPSVELLREAGLSFEATSRALSAPVRNMPIEILFVRADDIPELVYDEVVQFGVTGLDLVTETSLDVDIVAELGFGRCALTAAVDQASLVQSIEDFDGLRVATSHPGMVERYFDSKSIDVTTVPLRGSVEVAPMLDIADAIVDLVSTGSTLMTNGLRPIATLLESQAVMICTNPVPASPIPTMVKAVVAARRQKYVLMNASEDAINDICDIIPGAGAPTIVPLSEPGKYAVHSVVETDELWSVLPKLEAVGASAILVLPISQMIP